ncbi:MAG: FeoB-associated Cys-rich membrane protein [Oscillospiraceae bacterium]|jgi:hypothetical protein|nr:FeoB-associated Cys-rich membrane protein [Oscillospiraceae bacterium]
MGTYIVGAIVFGIIAAIIVTRVRAARRGESGCSCGCSGCDAKNACETKE